MACINSPGSALNRPPHIFWPADALSRAEFGLGVLAMTFSRLFTLGNAIRFMILFGLFALSGVLVQSCNGPEGALDRFAKGSLKGLTQLEAPPQRPSSLAFQTLEGVPVQLSQFDGQILLLNAWATWCPPCVAEMPSLDRLQRLRGGPDFQVVAISADRNKEIAAEWIAENDITDMTIWHDGSFRLAGEVKLPGFPTTIIYNRQGREVARLSGEADWASDEALALIDYWIAQ